MYAIQTNNIGTIIVNIRVSALPKTLPPRYKKVKNNRKRTEKSVFRQFERVTIKQKQQNTAIKPFNGNLKSFEGFSN